MATVHFGRLLGAVEFSRTVAIEHLLPHYSHDAEFISMFLDEARLAARIQHPNVTVPLDVIVLEESEEIFLVMEYVHGDTLARLLKGAQVAKAPERRVPKLDRPCREYRPRRDHTALRQ